RFCQAVESIRLSPATEAALAAWRRDAESIVPAQPWRNFPGRHPELCNPFEAAFELSPFQAVGELLCVKDSPVGYEPRADNCDMIINDRVPPAAILAYAFGPAWLARMPGVSLNCFATAREVPALARRVSRLFKPWRWHHAAIRRRAEIWADQSNGG